MELAANPELALAWADQLTTGPGRQAVLTQTAVALAASDPSAAFALADQLPESQRQVFFDSVFAGWAKNDAQGALQYANQLPDPEREAAIHAISTAPIEC